jgi:hypothetical protein
LYATFSLNSSGNQNPYIEEQTTQRPKEKAEKDKQRSIKHTQKTSLRDLPLIFAFYCYFIFFYIYGAKVKIVEKNPTKYKKSKKDKENELMY